MAQSQPSSAPVRQPQQRQSQLRPDYLAQLLVDIPRQQDRIKKLEGVEASKLPKVILQEVVGTVMSIQRDQAHHTKELRDFAVQEIIQMRQALMALDVAYGQLQEQVQTLEETGGGDLSTEEVTKLTLLADGTLTIIDQMVQMPSIGEPLKQALIAHRQLAVECQSILASFDSEEEQGD